MDILTLITLLVVLYFVACATIVVLADCDIMTFLATKFSKSPEHFYSGKVVWITGASNGIGEAIAKELAKHNAKLVLSARRNDELLRVKELCLASNPSIADKNILVLPFDMCDLSAHRRCFQTVLSHFGKLDILVSNAGRSQRALWHEIDISVDKELFDLNVFSLINLNRIVVKYFLEVGRGHVVVNSSVAGIIGIPYSGSYDGSKHALLGYFKCLRNEVGSNNIRVTVLLPGPTFSGFLSEAFTAESGKKFGKSMNPSDNRMTAERCAFLSAVGIANGIEEVWMGLRPIVILSYLNSYAPYVYSKLESLMRSRGTFIKLRDSRDTTREL